MGVLGVNTAGASEGAAGSGSKGVSLPCSPARNILACHFDFSLASFISVAESSWGSAASAELVLPRENNVLTLELKLDLKELDVSFAVRERVCVCVS
jgi:hypothetical protein